MSDFKDRLLTEKTEVDTRIEKLESFIGSEKFQLIDTVQMSLLNIQISAMRAYSQCLTERIARL